MKLLSIFVMLAGFYLSIQGSLNARLRLALESPYSLQPSAFFQQSRPSVYYGDQRIRWCRNGDAWIPVCSALGLPRRNPRDWLCFRLDYRCSHVGVVVSVGAAILGQMLGFFLVDTFGWLGVNKIPFDPLRLLGIDLLVTGVLLVQRK
jgi:uncharacterized membrane protein YdcZ (DUF606 family)